jgi:hypothetical protein
MTDTNDTPKPGAVDALRDLTETVRRVALSGDYALEGDAISALTDALHDAEAALAAPHGQPAVDEAARYRFALESIVGWIDEGGYDAIATIERCARKALAQPHAQEAAPRGNGEAERDCAWCGEWFGKHAAGCRNAPPPAAQASDTGRGGAQA